MEIREKILSNCGEDPFFWCSIGLSLEQTIYFIATQGAAGVESL